jgi:glutathione synthase/RimK-type ligase-like ATP-grasp enzyme
MKIRLRSQTLRNSALKIIQQHLEGMGVEVIRGRVEAKDIPIINWGISGIEQLPSLNENCNKYDKWEALTRFISAGVRAPRPFELTKAGLGDTKFPILARLVSHKRGNDIVKVDNLEALFDVAYTHEFGVPYIPKVAEYRTWVFRDEVVAVYSKRYQGKGKYDGVIWNHQDGLFKFVSLKEANWPKGIMGPSIMAVKSLHLDFGACDVMKDKDGQLWMLEVNTAPHIDNVERKSGQMLAKRMYEWAKEFE